MAETETETETLTVPSFTVLKNGSILKNIILLNQSSSSSSSQEQILLVGRHPHCNITLGHPSISRYHLRIHSNPRSHSISVFDLSSVHGTWVCGMRVKPGVFVRLNEGDTVKIGGSSRVYELHWVPVNTGDVYAVKQDEIDDTCSLDDDIESLEWPLEDKVENSPFKKLDPLICSVSEYLSSSGDDTEGGHSSSSNESNEGNKNGQVFSAILDQPESVVVQTVPEVHDFNSVSELEPQVDGVNKEDAVSELVVNSSCEATEVEPSSPLGTGNEIGDVFAPALAHSPFVVLEGMSETEVSDSLDKSEDQLKWLRDNVSDEFVLQSEGIIKEDLVSVSNCCKSMCDDAEVEPSSPKKTGKINGELFTPVSIRPPFVVSEAISEAEVSDSLVKSEDESNWLRDNISNEFVQFGYGTMKEDLISVATFDALNQDIAGSDEINIGKEIEQVNEREIDNWLRDNVSNEFEQLSNGTVKDDMVSVALSEDIKTSKRDASAKEIARNDDTDMGNENEPLIQQEIGNGCVKGDADGSFTPNREGGNEVDCVFEQVNQIKTTDESASVILCDGLDNEVDISNEFGQLSHSAMKEDLISGASFDDVKMDEKDILNQDAASDEIETGNQIEFVIQQENDNGSISVALNDDVKGDEEEPFVADMAGAEEVNLGCEFEQMYKMIVMDESASVILFDGLEDEVDMGIDNGSISVSLYDDVKGDEEEPFVADIAGAMEVNLDCEFEQMNKMIMIDESASAILFDGLEDEVDMGINNGSISVALSDDVKEDEDEAFVADMAGAEEVNLVCEFEQMNKMTIMDESASVIPFDGLEDEVDMGIDNGSISVALYDNVKGAEEEPFVADIAGAEEVNLGCEFEQMNKMIMMDESASVILFDGIEDEVDMGIDNGSISVALNDDVKKDEEEPFVADIAGAEEVNLGCEFEQMNKMIMMDESASVILFDGIENEVDMGIDNGSISVALNDDVKKDEEEPFVADIAGAEEVNLGCEFEQMNKMNIMDESASVILFNGLDNKVDMGSEIELIDAEIMKKESVFEAIPDGTDLDQKQNLTPVSRVKEVCMNLEAMMKGSVPTNLFDSLDENEFEFFTPDKENKNPEARSGKSLQKRWKKAVSPIINEEKDIFGFSKRVLTNVDESKNVFTADEEKFASNSLLQRSPNTTDKVDPSVHCVEVLFSPKIETKSGQVEMEASCNSINYPDTVQKVIDSSQNVLGEAKKRWSMVVDTSTLLHDGSLKHLKLLKGLKGTQLFIPKTVIRELMDLKSQYAFYKSSTVKATLALQWIDELMVTTSWWIHMDDEILHHSQAETEVLQSALRLRKEITDGKIIILSNDLTLKIKAMAEGVMCEEAEEFRRSLVNPFSERFMWVGSSARGLTWSCADDAVRNYHGCSLYGSHRLKGLRLLARG